MNPSHHIRYSHLRYLRRQEIDAAKWDHCIDNAPNGLIYANTAYLDHMARQWDALVLGDYEAVMPLTWNKKWGFRYLYQPPLTPQLGIFSPLPISAGLVDGFLEKLEQHFKFAEIMLNFANGDVRPDIALPHDPHPNDPHPPHAPLQPRTNYILHLQPPYEVLRGQYKEHLLRNLKKAAGFSLQYSPFSDPALAIDLYKRHYAERTRHVRDSDYQHFANFCSQAQKEDNLILRAVTASPDPTTAPPAPGPLTEPSALHPIAKAPPPGPIAIALLLKKSGRLSLLISASLEEGRAKKANHFLLDQLIREFAGSATIFDFEGSDLPGVARFYSNFGGIDQPYFFYRLNRLPWPLRLFK